MRAAIAEALRRYAGRVALITEDGASWSYLQLEKLAREIGEKLPTSALTVIEGNNSPATIASYLGVLLRGGLVHFTELGRGETLGQAFQPWARIVCEGEKWTLELNDQLGSGSPINKDLVLLFSTSGSSGARKLVKITEKNILSNTESIINYLGLHCDHIAITSLKPSYTYGLSVINSQLLSGGTLLLTNRSIQDPAFWMIAQQHGATLFSGVPHTYEFLAKNNFLENTPSLKLLTQAGGKLSPQLVKHYAARGRAAGWRFFVMYGQTEASPRISYLPPEFAEAAPESIGLAIPGGSLYIEDEVGLPINAADIEGELVYYGPNVMAGYATNRADLVTAECIGRLATGDLARRRADGLFVITGRRSRFIKPLGRRIGLDDVEQLLSEWGINAAVLPQGEGLLVVYERSKSFTKRHLSSALGLPTVFVNSRSVDSLPRLTSGKIDYQALKSESHELNCLLNHFPRFVSDTGREVLKILFGDNSEREISQIFTEVFYRPVCVSDSFVSLGGDSINYVELSLALEEAMGPLPHGWVSMPVGELERWRFNHLK